MEWKASASMLHRLEFVSMSSATHRWPHGGMEIPFTLVISQFQIAWFMRAAGCVLFDGSGVPHIERFDSRALPMVPGNPT